MEFEYLTYAYNKIKPSVTQHTFEVRLTCLIEGNSQLIVNQDLMISVDNARWQAGQDT